MSTVRSISADDRFAIEQLLSSYGVFHDARDFVRLEACFTEDATYAMQIAGAAEPIRQQGSAAIVGQIREFKSRQHDQRRHVITNFLFDDVSADRVEVRSYVTVLATADDVLEVVSAGTYTDVVVRVGDEWRIAAKALQLDKGF